MKKFYLLALGFVVVSKTSFAFDLQSVNFKENAAITNDFVYQGMGCDGKNLSPELHWGHAPKETKGFAVTVYDPDAPTGSGWWHWIVINIPATKTSLPSGWKSSEAHDGIEIVNDFGAPGYGGPCPPPGKPHRYVFTVHAMKTDKLDVPAGASNAYVRFLIESQTIKKATMHAKYGR